MTFGLQCIKNQYCLLRLNDFCTPHCAFEFMCWEEWVECIRFTPRCGIFSKPQHRFHRLHKLSHFDVISFRQQNQCDGYLPLGCWVRAV